MTSQPVIEFIKSGRGKAQCPSDPDYPNGLAIPKPIGSGACCKVALPYPAPECGMWRVQCRDCKALVLITAAGRADDPVSFYLPCQGLN